MKEDILVIKKKKGFRTLDFKVTKKVKRGYNESYYQNVININDYKAWSRFFGDMERMFGAPINKAIREYKGKKGFPW